MHYTPSASQEQLLFRIFSSTETKSKLRSDKKSFSQIDDAFLLPERAQRTDENQFSNGSLLAPLDFHFPFDP
jgi:hypothetical protein